MSPEIFQILTLVFVVWGLAVAVKAVNALRSNTPYIFSMWDGGMLRAGKSLSRLGMQIKVVVGVLMSLGCVALLTGIVPFRTGAYVVIFVAMLSIVSDLVTGTKSTT